MVGVNFWFTNVLRKTAKRTLCQWYVRVIFVESESQALRVRVESESSKIFSSQSHDLVESSQSRATSSH